jgi:tyrosyl-tRNA synthetase
VDDAPDDMFGKLMSIPDSIMWRYFELLSAKSKRGDSKFKQYRGWAEPSHVKFELEIVDTYHGAGAG